MAELEIQKDKFEYCVKQSEKNIADIKQWQRDEIKRISEQSAEETDKEFRELIKSLTTYNTGYFIINR
jgi:vacuolar-type H+-ATPase subunit E/Vma4